MTQQSEQVSKCPRKKECGSCSWSHIPYEKQLQQKLSDINGSFALKEVSLECKEILPSPRIDHYRNRMDFVIDFEGRVGLRQKGKWWRVIDNHTCFISDNPIEQCFAVVREWVHASKLSFFDRKAHTGFLRYAVIRCSQAGELMLIVVTSNPESDKESEYATEQLEALAALSKCDTLVWSINSTVSDVSHGDTLKTISGSGQLNEQVNGFHYRISPHAFFQTNSYGAALLLETVDEFTGDLGQKNLLDLYCGSGFFSIALANQAARTVGVELMPEAIHDARVNAENNSVVVSYFDAKAEDYDWRGDNFDVVIVDPPRSGMHDKSLKQVIEVAPAELVYVSCSPKNFAREMVQLQEVYDVAAMRAIDMFPHTPHVELVTRLVRK